MSEQIRQDSSSKSVDIKLELITKKVDEYKQQSKLANKRLKKISKQRKITSKELFKHQIYAKFYDEDELQAQNQMDESNQAMDYLNNKMNAKLNAYKTKHEAMKHLETTIDQSVSEVKGRVQQLKKAVHEWQAANVIAFKQCQISNNNTIEKFHNWYQSVPLLNSLIQMEGKVHSSIYSSALCHGMQQELEAYHDLKQQLEEFATAHYSELLKNQPKLIPLKHVHDQRQSRSEAFDQFHWRLMKQLRVSVRICDNLQYDIEERERIRMKFLNMAMELKHLLQEQCNEAIQFSEIESKRSVDQILFYLQGQKGTIRRQMLDILHQHSDVLGRDELASSSTFAMDEETLQAMNAMEESSMVSSLSGSVLSTANTRTHTRRTKQQRHQRAVDLEADETDRYAIIQDILAAFQNHFYCDPSSTETVISSSSTANNNNNNNNQTEGCQFPNQKMQKKQLKHIQHTKELVTRYCDRLLPHVKGYYQMMQYYPDQLLPLPSSPSSSTKETNTYERPTTQEEKQPFYQVLQSLTAVDLMKHSCTNIAHDTIAMLKTMLISLKQSEGKEEDPVTTPSTPFIPLHEFPYAYNFNPDSLQTNNTAMRDNNLQQKLGESRIHSTAQELIQRVNALFAQERNSLETWMMDCTTREFKLGKDKLDASFAQYASENNISLETKDISTHIVEELPINHVFHPIQEEFAGRNSSLQHHPTAPLGFEAKMIHIPLSRSTKEGTMVMMGTDGKKMNKLLEIALQPPDGKALLNSDSNKAGDNSESAVQGLLTYSANLLHKIKADLDHNMP